MKILRILALQAALALYPAIAGAQNVITESSVTVVSYWVIGENHRFACTHTEEKKGEGEDSKKTASYNIDMSIVGANDTSYFIEAKYNGIQADSSADYAEKLMAQLMEGFVVKYRTDELGALQEIKNVDEIKAYLVKGYEMAIAQYKGKEGLYDSLLQVKEYLTSDEMVLQACEEITMLHFFHGGEYNRLKPGYGASEFPNLFGGPAFPAQAKIEVSKVATDKSQFEVSQFTKLDAVAAKPLILSTLKTVYKNLGIPIPEDAELIKHLEIKESINAQIQAETGWPLHVENVRLNRVNAVSDKKVTQIDLVY